MADFTTVKSVALIGSFRRYYEEVCSALLAFSEAKLKVTSPKGTPRIEKDVPFVRFTSDPKHLTDPEIQTLALHRILRANFVFVVAPSGYVGKTTCYEIGRLIQAKQPLYFSERPEDLPIYVPLEHIKSTTDIINLIKKNGFRPTPMYVSDKQNQSEYDLLNGFYRKDEYFKGY